MTGSATTTRVNITQNLETHKETPINTFEFNQNKEKETKDKQREKEKTERRKNKQE